MGTALYIVNAEKNVRRPRYCYQSIGVVGEESTPLVEYSYMAKLTRETWREMESAISVLNIKIPPVSERNAFDALCRRLASCSQFEANQWSKVLAKVRSKHEELGRHSIRSLGKKLDSVTRIKGAPIRVMSNLKAGEKAQLNPAHDYVAKPKKQRRGPWEKGQKVHTAR